MKVRNTIEVVKFDAADIAPMITYGTNPGMGIKVTDRIPTVNELKDISEQTSFSKSLEYMGLEARITILGKPLTMYLSEAVPMHALKISNGCIDRERKKESIKC